MYQGIFEQVTNSLWAGYRDEYSFYENECAYVAELPYLVGSIKWHNSSNIKAASPPVSASYVHMETQSASSLQ